MSEVINQHYVPRCYLNNFTTHQKQKNSHLWVFDKYSQKQFLTHVSNVACERRFYDLSKEVVDVPDPQYVEKFLGNFENESKKLVSRVVKRVEYLLTDVSKYSLIEVLDSRDKVDLSYLVAVQFLRTLEHRKKFVDFSEKSLKAILEKALKIEFPNENNELEVKLSEKALPVHQFNQIIESSKNISEIILNHIWLLGVNQTSQPFFTSDHPVVTMPHLKDNGFACQGIEIAFPLTSKIILLMFEKTHFQTFIHKNNKLLLMPSIKAVNYYNKLQVYSSTRQVYCSESNFDIVRDICQRNPDICSENRSRINVIS